MRPVRVLLWAFCALAVFLAFGWPFVVSSDPASAAYRWLAIAALCGILGAVGALVVRKLLQARG